MSTADTWRTRIEYHLIGIIGYNDTGLESS